jgi:EAL domain-containing protein (putative c-di-GMP-specific phosphodiesterase class I)
VNSAKSIREAIDRDGLVLFAQPIVELRSGRVERHELLVRMRSPEGEELIQPGEFLPEAERVGLVGDIDRWVVGQAISMLDDGRFDCLEVNLSGMSLVGPEVLGAIEKLIRSSNIEPADLVFEITETAAIANMAEATEFASRLKQLGCRFALDDFGVAFGSLYYLKHLPIDYVKIDGEFIRELARDPADQVIVKAIVELAGGLDIGTIAEFVGDDETTALLREYGVDYAQGEHIGEPRPVDPAGSRSPAAPR